MGWEEYYKKLENTPPRPLLLEVLKIGSFKPGMKAIDLGCGAGVETLYLLQNQWNVIAVEREISGIQLLRQELDERLQSKLCLIQSSFEELTDLPSVNLVFASLSIPFCKPDFFNQFWQLIDTSILSNGYFAGNFFGPDDEWVQQNGLCGISAEDLRELFKNFEILKWDEKNEIGPTALGSNKNWHIFTIIAQKRQPLGKC